MNLLHDAIKIELVREGYLPNYPYHLISDEEMFHAFLNDSGNDMFHYYYPCIDSNLEDEYNMLIQSIQYHVGQHLSDSSFVIPDWVYSYMQKSAIGPNSSIADKHDMFVMLGLDNIEDEFTPKICAACYDISSSWIRKLPDVTTVKYNGHTISTRPPTIFGELHVLKCLRLLHADITGRIKATYKE